MNQKLREYVAIIWKKQSDEPGIHEHFYASNREEAHAYLEEKFGTDVIISLKDVEAAQRPR